jgi:hypothetical protein
LPFGRIGKQSIHLGVQPTYRRISTSVVVQQFPVHAPRPFEFIAGGAYFLWMPETEGAKVRI